MNQLENKKIGKVYRIKSPNSDDEYIGSTFLTLNRRFSVHKSNYNKYLGSGIKKTCIQSIPIFEHQDAYIELISEHVNIDKKDLLKLEGEEIKKSSNALNKKIAGRTNNEYRRESGFNKRDYQKRKEYINNYNKKYRELKKMNKDL